VNVRIGAALVARQRSSGTRGVPVFGVVPKEALFVSHRPDWAKLALSLVEHARLPAEPG